MTRKTDHSTRRDLLRKAGVGATAGLVSGIIDTRRVCATQVAAEKNHEDSDAERDNFITRENALPGATDWQLTRVRTEPADGVRCPAIEGFCTRQSVSAGETQGSVFPPHWRNLLSWKFFEPGTTEVVVLA